MAAPGRSALIVASDAYDDPGLQQLRAPARDAEALASVLADERIGGFEVRTLLNEPAHAISMAVEDFFADRRPDDLLLLHLSCHGVKDESGDLHFATTNTELRRLASTSVAADFVNRRMNRSRSRRIVLLLDCCYAGAFERGMTARSGAAVGLEEQFGGRGRAVITASSAMEYAFEGETLTDTDLSTPSVFTTALVDGLRSGEADHDQDGLVSLDELYDHVYARVRETTPNQTPGKWTFGVQGELYIARRAGPVTVPTPLPVELQQVLEHPLAGVRGGAVQELTRLMHGGHAGLALAARLALERLTDDDSRTVAASAMAALATAMTPGAEAAAFEPTPRSEVPAPEEDASPPEVTTSEVSAPAADRPAADLPPGDRPPADLPPGTAPAASALVWSDDDRTRWIAGSLALASAALLFGGLFPAFLWDASLPRTSYELSPLSWYVVFIAFAAAVAAAAMLRGRRPFLANLGLLIGVGAASCFGLGTLIGISIVASDRGPGSWLMLAGHVLLLTGAGVAARAAARLPDVHLHSRPPRSASGDLRRLAILLGLGAAGALAFHLFEVLQDRWQFINSDFEGAWPVTSAVLATGLAASVPAVAATALPRRFAVSLLTGWLVGGTAIAAYYNRLVVLFLDNGHELPAVPMVVFALTLVALAGVTVLLARVDEPSPVASGTSA